ncbi:MAG: hypothetical protein HGA23_02405 [Bacteroidales bacterium]|nr:hypothetical protein [Bacteroidales bacterium]
MKKTITFFAIMFIMTFIVHSQELAGRRLSAPKGFDPGDYDCPANTIFSQPPNGWSDSWINSYGYIQVIYDKFYGVTEPIIGVRYWQAKYDGTLTYPIQFTVEFYQDNGGVLGALVNSWEMNLSPTFTTVDGFDVIDITLPSSVNLSTGWLGINANDVRLGSGDARVGWVNNVTGDGNVIFTQDLINYYSVNDPVYNVSFCLVGSGSPLEVPISNWALFIGIGLILVLAIVRFRKLV